jgi:hypothetical protein
MGNWKVDPVELDNKISQAYEELWAKRTKVEMLAGDVKNFQGYVDKGQAYAVSLLEGLKKKLEIAQEEKRAVQQVVNDLNAQYEGWNRCFWVQNSNGHIHKSMECATCYPSTRYAWLPDWSDRDEMEIIKAAGEKACSVCYPNAPSEYLARKSVLEPREVIEAREERLRVKQEKAQKAEKAGIKNPDGSQLRVNESGSKYGGQVIGTERSASILAVDVMMSLKLYEVEADRYQGRKPFEEVALEQLLVALAFKHGVSVEEEREAIKVKADKKLAKYLKEVEDWMRSRV